MATCERKHGRYQRYQRRSSRRDGNQDYHRGELNAESGVSLLGMHLNAENLEQKRDKTMGQQNLFQLLEIRCTRNRLKLRLLRKRKLPIVQEPGSQTLNERDGLVGQTISYECGLPFIASTTMSMLYPSTVPDFTTFSGGSESNGAFTASRSFLLMTPKIS